MNFRSNEQFAKESFEFFLLEEAPRRMFAEFFAQSIRHAHALAPDRWGITLYSNLVRMNFGMIEILRAIPDWLLIRIDSRTAPAFPSALNPEEEVVVEETGFKTVPDAAACGFHVSQIENVLPAIQVSHRILLEKAARTPRHNMTSKAHSPGVISYLSSYLGMLLPQPAYFAPDQEEAYAIYLSDWSSVVEFHDETHNEAHDLFQRWRRENWDGGYFINFKSRTRFVLHTASCTHPGDGEWIQEENGSTLTKNKKACSTDLKELLNWAKQVGVGKVEACKDCKPDWGAPEQTLLDVPPLPEEMDETQQYAEGTVKQILVNAYERNPEARTACINHYGPRCIVCESSLEEKYGSVAKDFIHVHHRTPLSSPGRSTQTDPVRDLCPVCPNCHAIIHRKDPPYTPEEVAQMIKLAAQDNLKLS